MSSDSTQRTNLSRSDLEEVGLTQEGFEEVAGTYDKKELMEMTHEFIKEYVLAVDRKASILMTGLSGLLGLGANAVNLQDLSIGGPILVPLSLSATMGLLGILFCGWVIYPRAYPPHNPGFIYWERIRQFGSRENFITAVERMDRDQPLKEITKNVYNTSDIAARKYAWLRWAMGSTLGMFYFATVAAIWYLHGSWLWAVALPTGVVGVLAVGLLAENQRSVAQSTATFGTDEDGRLALLFDGGEGSKLHLDTDAGPDENRIEIEDIPADRRTVEVRLPDDTGRRRWAIAGAGVVAYALAVAALGRLTANWPMAISVASVAAVTLGAGFLSGDKREVQQEDATFDVGAGRSILLQVRSLADRPREISVEEREDGTLVTFEGLPPNHIVHVTDPDKTPYEVFRD